MRLLPAAIVLSTTVLAVFGNYNCHQHAQKLDECLLKVERSQDFKKLKNQEKSTLKTCVAANPGTQCQISSAQGEKCRDKARDDPSLKSALKAMYGGIDACFDGSINSPYSVLRMAGDLGAVAQRRHSKSNQGGGSSSSGLTTTPAPVVFDNSDAQTQSNTDASGSSTPPPPSPAANCPPQPDSSSSLGGGSSTDVTGNSGTSDPTSLAGGLAGLSSLTGGAGGAASLAGGGAVGAGGLPFDTSALSGLLSGGKRKKRQTDTVQSVCKPIYQCIAAAKQKENGRDNGISRTAGKIYDDIQRCKADNHPPLACVPSTRQQKECVGAARKNYQTQLKAFMATCLGQIAQSTTNGM